MYFVKGADGELINVGKAIAVRVERGELLADFGDASWVIYRGTLAECGKVRDNLFSNLKEHQRAVYEVRD